MVSDDFVSRRMAEWEQIGISGGSVAKLITHDYFSIMSEFGRIQCLPRFHNFLGSFLYCMFFFFLELCPHWDRACFLSIAFVQLLTERFIRLSS